jgi:hypothetical protein
MPAVLVTIGVYIISSVIAKLLLALGIGLFTYYGLYTLVQRLLQEVQTAFGGLPSQVSQILAIAGIPEALSIIGSAVLTWAAIKSMQVFFGTRV